MQAFAQEQERQQQQQQSSAKPETAHKLDGIDANVVDDVNACIKVSRKVFSGKQWLTIEDWLECSIPLCALDVKHEGRIERSPDNVVQTIFASARLGGGFLSNGWSQVCTLDKNHAIFFYVYLSIYMNLQRLNSDVCLFFFLLVFSFYFGTKN